MVTKLYEVGAKPEAEDAQLWTGSDTVSPGQGWNLRKNSVRGSENPLKSVFFGRSRVSDSVFGSWSLIDCRFQFLTLYISVYDSSASHVLGVHCKDLSEDVSSRQHYDFSQARCCRLKWHSRSDSTCCWGLCWPNNPSETDGKQIKRRPNAANTRIHLDYITLTLRLFNEPCTNILISTAALLLSWTNFTLIVFMANWVIQQLSC